MDRIEKIIQDELLNNKHEDQLDIDSILDGVHSNIHRRSIIRKTLYSSPVAVLILLMVFSMYPGKSGEMTTPGEELLMAGWEQSWTETQTPEIEDSYDQVLYDQSVDYLTDDQYYLYENDTEDLLDVNDFEAFVSYLEEV